MDDMNYKNQPENNEKKSGTFWKNFAIMLLSILLSILTIVVITANK